MNNLRDHFFWKYAFRKNRLFDNLDLEKTNTAIVFSMRTFYVLLLVLSYSLLLDFSPFVKESLALPLWPVKWVNYFPDFPIIPLCIIVLFILLFTVLFSYHKRWLRIGVFGCLFFLIALLNSNGKINHSYHGLLIPSFFFIFFDFKKEGVNQNQLWFASAIFAQLSLYFLTGFWKVARGIKQAISGEISIFDMSSMTNHLLFEFRHKEITPIAEYFVQHEPLGFGFLWMGVLIELTPIFFFFRAKAHPIAGIILILLHTGIMWVMHIGFFQTIYTIIPLLLLSPFYKTTSTKY